MTISTTGGLAGRIPKTLIGGRDLDFLACCGQKKTELRAATGKGNLAQDRHVKKLRLPGKLVDCSATNKIGTELFIVRGRFGGRDLPRWAATVAKPQACCPAWENPEPRWGGPLCVAQSLTTEWGRDQRPVLSMGVGLGNKFS